MKQTQEQRVIAILKSQGYISRNACLANYISRLSAIIQDLEAKGWEFTTRREKGDYEYHIVKQAMKTVIKVVEREGKFFPTKIQVPV